MTRSLAGLIVSVLCLLQLPTPVASEEAPAAADRPNVLVFMTDDQTLEQMRWLPSVREFMTDGTEYSNSLTNYALCGPSRATFLTGQHATNHGLWCNPGLASKFRKRERNSLAPWLQSAGVHTIHVGKYLNGYGGTTAMRYVPPGWSDWRALLGDSAYRYTRFDMLLNDRVVRFGLGGSPAYSTDVLSDQLDDALRAAPPTAPFFAVFTPLAPHNESGRRYAIPAPRHEGRVRDVLRPPNYDSCQVWSVGTCPPVGSSLMKGTLPAAERAVIDNHYQTASESLFAVDEAFQRVLQTLREIGRLDSTVIIFTSDNGFFYGEHGVRQGKIRPGREALFVPLFIAGPGFRGGGKIDAPVSNVDLAPTIVDLFSATPGIEMDGQSLLDPIDPHRAIFIQSDLYELGGFRGVYADGWLYFHYKRSTSLSELYAPGDVHQLHALGEDSRYRTVKEDLRALTLRMQTCAGRRCLTTWSAS